MIDFIVRRILWAVLVVMLAGTVVFMLQFGFGDIAVNLGPNASAERRQEFREDNGVDKPWLTFDGIAQIDSSADRQTVVRGYHRLLQCYRKSITRGEKSGGSLPVHLDVDGAGHVTNVRFQDTSLGDAEFKTCSQEIIQGSSEEKTSGWHFSREGSAMPTDVAFTLRGGTFSLLHQFSSYVGITDCLRSEEYRSHPGASGGCGILQGDLGVSFSHQDSVIATIWQRLPRTILLGAMTICFEMSIGLLIGILAATRRNTWIDTVVMAGAFLGISLPTFVSGLLFLFYFAFLLGWFPVGGYGVTFFDHIYHGLLPAFTLAIVGAATYARIMRSEMIETLGNDYIRTARAKGLSPFRTVVIHGVRNAMLPIVTIAGLSLPFVVSGAIITEGIFAWPGVGSLAIESITNTDAFTVMGIVLIIALSVQVGNIVADVGVAALDPRIRLSAQKSK